MRIKGYFISTFIMLSVAIASTHGQSIEKIVLPEPKRLIDKIELFAGPNLSFNYGNMFIENYRGEYANDNYVVNKRLLKPGYAVGVGIYHPFTDRIDLNIRLSYEEKGTKNELNTPSLPDGNREINYHNYSYRYYSLIITPQAYLGEQKRIVLSLGLSYSKIREISGNGRTYNTNGTYYSEGSYKGRYFSDLRDDGVIQGFAWMPYLTSIEDYDWGFVTSIGYRIPFKEKHSILIQLQNNFGLKNINKSNPYGLEEKNHLLSLIIGYTYHLPSKSLRL